MMQRIKKTAAPDCAELAPTAFAESGEGYDPFATVQTFCMFLGYPRSGHSLIGALLDAHSNMIIAHELDALQYVAAGFSRRQLFHLLLENSQRARASGRKWGNYSYAVPNQWQGRFEKLQVIGDKKGGGSAKLLRSAPQLLQRLRDTVDANVKYIHVTRNPFDNISTSKKHKKHDVDLTDRIDSYFARCQTINEIKQQMDGNSVFEIKYETFIDDPRAGLGELCRYLGTVASADYLNDCASIVHRSTHKSRFEVNWPTALIDQVEEKIGQFPFLGGYSWES
jgi:hypothetical protein